MGVIYKLKPEIKDFILEQKKAQPILSCRGLIDVIEGRFQIKVSKSSINALFKEAQLSMPVGRRPKKRRQVTKKQLMLPVIEVKPPESLAVLPGPPIEPKAEELIKPAPQPEPIILEEPKPPASIEVARPEIQIERIEEPLEPIGTGAFLLKAADYLLGGSYHISEAIKKRLNSQDKDILAKTESLVYLPFFSLDNDGTGNSLSALWPLIGKRITLEMIKSYLNDLQQVRTIGVDIVRIISNILQEIRCIRINYPDGNLLYLDGQLQTVWSTPHMPASFSTTLYNTKSYINKYLFTDMPFVLSMAPGYDTPTKEFFNFIINLNSQGKSAARLTLYDNNFEEVEVISMEQSKKRPFIFGLWPWQFQEYRKVKSVGEFQPFYFEPLGKDYYIAPIELELLQPTTREQVTFIGIVLKSALNEKARLAILSNLPFEAMKPEELASTYLSHWPNLEEAFQDFSRKIELFTYTADSQGALSIENLNSGIKEDDKIDVLLNHYVRVLDLYAKKHFFPVNSDKLDFETTNQRFYQLKAQLIPKNNSMLIHFLAEEGYPYRAQLQYACDRINQREVYFADGQRAWCAIK